MSKKVKILFLCTGNSCRSQIAEAWSRALKGERIEPYSAGVNPNPAGIDPMAAKVMAEAGIDISRQRPKDIMEVEGIDFDYVITVCDNAREFCPVFPGKITAIHQSFQDPPLLAASAQTEEEVLQRYRRIRDEIKAFVERLPDILTK